MRGYGLPREFGVEYPDPYDGILYGLKSSALNLRRKGGDYKNSVHSSRCKRLARISWKGRARTLAKRELRDFLQKGE